METHGTKPDLENANWTLQELIAGERACFCQRMGSSEAGGDAAIKQWISGQMKGCTCLIVLAGAETASRPWVRYEIEKGWNDGLGVLGVRIHGLKNSLGNTSFAGPNPFEGFNVGSTPLNQILKLYDPTGSNSQGIYKDIHDRIPSLVESAIRIRKTY